MSFDHVPIAILTGYHEESLFLTKPFNPAELLRALAPYLPLDNHGRTALSQIVHLDRGLRLQDVAHARLPAHPV